MLPMNLRTEQRMRRTILPILVVLAAAGCGSSSDEQSSKPDTATMAANIKREFQAELDRRLDETAPGDDVSADVTNVDCVSQTKSTARCLASVTAQSGTTTMKRTVSIDVTVDDARLIWETRGSLSDIFQ